MRRKRERETHLSTSPIQILRSFILHSCIHTCQPHRRKEGAPMPTHPPTQSRTSHRQAHPPCTMPYVRPNGSNQPHMHTTATAKKKKPPSRGRSPPLQPKKGYIFFPSLILLIPALNPPLPCSSLTSHTTKAWFMIRILSLFPASTFSLTSTVDSSPPPSFLSTLAKTLELNNKKMKKDDIFFSCPHSSCPP